MNSTVNDFSLLMERVLVNSLDIVVVISDDNSDVIPSTDGADTELEIVELISMSLLTEVSWVTPVVNEIVVAPASPCFGSHLADNFNGRFLRNWQVFVLSLGLAHVPPAPALSPLSE